MGGWVEELRKLLTQQVCRQGEGEGRENGRRKWETADVTAWREGGGGGGGGRGGGRGGGGGGWMEHLKCPPLPPPPSSGERRR